MKKYLLIAVCFSLYGQATQERSCVQVLYSFMNNIVSYGRQLWKSSYNKIHQKNGASQKKNEGVAVSSTKQSWFGGVIRRLSQCFSDPIAVSSFTDLVKNGDLAKVNQLIKNGIDVNMLDLKNGYTALHYAAEYGHLTIAELLLANGADVHAKNNQGQTPLHCAIYSKSEEIISFLVSKGADINSKNNDGMTPLHEACKWNSASQVPALLVNGSDVNASDKYGSTPLHIASYSFDETILRLLLENKCSAPTLDIKNNSGNTPLHVACLTMAMGCGAGGCTDAVKLLLEHGASINIQNNHGQTPMAIAIRRNMNISKLLLERGADVNTKDEGGNTLLHIILSPCDAWRRFFPEMFELILTNERVDLNIKNNEEKTPLHCACSQGLVDMAKRLVEAGAELTIQDNAGKTPLDHLKEWCKDNNNTSLYSSYEQQLNESYNKSRSMYKDIANMWQ